MTPPQLHLPTIRVSDIEILADWDFENVKALGDSIPGFRSSSSESTCLFSSPIPSLSPYVLGWGNDHIVNKHQLS